MTDELKPKNCPYCNNTGQIIIRSCGYINGAGKPCDQHGEGVIVEVVSSGGGGAGFWISNEEKETNQ